jgi:hypothetical protein
MGAAIGWLTYNTAGMAAELATGGLTAEVAGVSAVEMGVTMGTTAGAVGGAAGYTLNSQVNGGTWYADQMMGSATTGAFSGAAGGATGAYLGSGSYNINLLGNTGASFLSGGVSNGVGNMMGGGSFSSGFWRGGLTSLAGSTLTSVLTPRAAGTYDGNNLSKANLNKGDVIAFGRDGTGISEFIADATGEDYSHIGVIDSDKGVLFVREAIGAGKEIKTPLSRYSNRPFKMIGTETLITAFHTQLGGYNGFETNCTSQATRWTGQGYINNPGVLARNMMGQSSYYNSPSIYGGR